MADATGGFVSMGNGVGSWGVTLTRFFITNKMPILIIMLILIAFAAWTAYYIYSEFMTDLTSNKSYKIGKIKLKIDIRGYLHWFLSRALRRPGVK
jgi:uncharacterized membrane-anchored protein